MASDNKDTGATVSVEENEDTLSFNIEVPNDVTEPVKKSISEKAKDFIKNTFNEDTKDSTPDNGGTSTGKRGRPKSNTKTSGFTFQSQVSLVSVGAITLMAMFVPPTWQDVYRVNEETFSLMPTKDEMSAITLPMLRIADRHTHFDKANPDVSDLALCVVAIIAYSFNVNAHLMMIRAIQVEEENAKRQANNAYGDSFSNGPTV